MNRYIMHIEAPEGWQITNGVLWNAAHEEERFYNALPCIYTDVRYPVHFVCYPSRINFKGRKGTVKAAHRRILNLKGLRKGMRFKIVSRYWPVADKIFTVKRDTPAPTFEANDPKLTAPTFDELGEALRRRGWYVTIKNHDNVKAAIAHGNGKVAAWTEGNEPLHDWYSAGCDNVLWANYGDFDKWSACDRIPKSTDWRQIEAILTGSV